jgi:hypothetical protein
VLPLLVLGLGGALLVAAWLLLRSFGPRLRVARLLAATPRVSVAEAVQLAEAGTRRYVRVDGRIDSGDEFEDAEHRPLVLRRTRLQAAERRGWRTFSDERRLVEFSLNEGLATIAVDGAALDEGLVVVPRESTGTAAELGPAGDGLDPTQRVRLRVEQVSSVEHATALGVPVRDGEAVRLAPGLGRPLVLTTLEPGEAMRIIAEGRTIVPRAAAVLLGSGLALILLGLGWLLIEAIA